MVRLHGQQLFMALKAAGFPVPDECYSASIYMGVTDALTIRYECFITQEQMPVLAAAFAALGEPLPNTPGEGTRTAVDWTRGE